MAERGHRGANEEPSPGSRRSRSAGEASRIELQGMPVPGGDPTEEDAALERTVIVLEQLFGFLTEHLITPVSEEIKSIIGAIHLRLRFGRLLELELGRVPDSVIMTTLEATAGLVAPGRRVTVEMSGLSVSVQGDGGVAVQEVTPPAEARRAVQALSGVTLPIAPVVVQKILNLAADPQAGIAQAVRLIERDPVLAGRVIQYVNSARFGLSRRITDLGSAATIIGYTSLRALALGCAFRSAWAGRCAEFDYDEFWRKSAATGAAAHQLAASMGSVTPEDALTIGLLADIGRLALATSDPQRYALVLANAGTSTSQLLLDTEQRHFGITHHDATLFLLLDWNLPQDYAQATLYQDEESPPPLPRDAAAMHQILHFAVHMSAIFTWPRQRPTSHVLAHVERHATAAVGDNRLAAGVFNGAIAEWYDIGEMLGVRTSPVMPWSAA
ncbi:MAG: HDOD domain-containing protein [bacterium]|nr:HDOD domain-containing protein [bacterium]